MNYVCILYLPISSFVPCYESDSLLVYQRTLQSSNSHFLREYQVLSTLVKVHWYQNFTALFLILFRLVLFVLLGDTNPSKNYRAKGERNLVAGS